MFIAFERANDDAISHCWGCSRTSGRILMIVHSEIVSSGFGHNRVQRGGS